MKYSIIMPYLQRHTQLERTFCSFGKFYFDRQDYEIIIVEDWKNQINQVETEKLKRLLDYYRILLDVPIIHLRREEEHTYNPCDHYNHGAAAASGKFLVLTNPECRHATNLLSTTDREFAYMENILLISLCITDKGMWIEHYTSQQGFHYCSILPKHIFDTVGGFDKRFQQGFLYDDNDFRNNIISHRINLKHISSLVVHQWHEKPYPHNIGALIEHNRNLTIKKWGSVLPETDLWL